MAHGGSIMESHICLNFTQIDYNFWKLIQLIRRIENLMNFFFLLNHEILQPDEIKKKIKNFILYDFISIYH